MHTKQQMLVVIFPLILGASSTMFNSRRDLISKETVLMSARSRTGTECAVWCAGREECATFSFDPTTKQCWLYPLDGGSVGVALQPANDTITFLKAGVWETSFKISEGNPPSAYDLWMNEGSQDLDASCDPAPSAPCPTLYKSNRVDNWEDVSEVRMEMYKDGSSVGYITFDGVGSDKSSWFEAGRLISSSWDDLKQYAAQYPTTISLEGRRSMYRFVVNSDLPIVGPCMRCDLGGWMHVLDVVSTESCSRPATRGIHLLYSTRRNRTILQTSTSGLFQTIPASGVEYVTTASIYPSVCALKDSSTVTREDLEEAYNLGQECCRCGWTEDGQHLVMQTISASCGSALGVIPYGGGCNAFCKNDIANIGIADTMVIFIR